MTAEALVRPAVASDLPCLATMGTKFFAASGFNKWFKYKPACFSQVCINLMVCEERLLLVGEGPKGAVAMAAAMLYPCWFNDEHVTCQELFWWVEPTYRGTLFGVKLRQGMEDWARGQGCSTMEMGALDASRPEALAQLYERKGYGPKERIFVKSLL